MSELRFALSGTLALDLACRVVTVYLTDESLYTQSYSLCYLIAGSEYT